MESEIELNVAIQELHALTTVPQFYDQLTVGNMTQNFLYLLNHENTDISCAIVHLLQVFYFTIGLFTICHYFIVSLCIQELSDIDTLNENEDAVEIISNLLIEGQLIGAMVKNVERLDEVNNKDEADGVYNTLAVVENIFEFKTEQLPQHLVINLRRGERREHTCAGKIYRGWGERANR